MLTLKFRDMFASRFSYLKLQYKHQFNLQNNKILFYEGTYSKDENVFKD